MEKGVIPCFALTDGAVNMLRMLHMIELIELHILPARHKNLKGSCASD